MNPRFLIPLLSLTVLTARAAGPEVTIVTGADAPALEQLAAKELEKSLVSVFAAKVTLTNTPGNAGHHILLGSPATNPAVKAAMGETWPADLGEQGHLLKSTPKGLVLGGGSPLATLWAVAEFAHVNGIRVMPDAEYLPLVTPAFSLAGQNEVFKPNKEIRGWRTLGSNPASQGIRGLDNLESLFLHLAKLKFNRVVLVMHASQVFAGAAAEGSGIWPGDPLDVTGDIAGRSVFGGAKVFDHPALATAKSPEERRDLAVVLVKKILKAATMLELETMIEVAGADEKKLAEIAALYPEADAVLSKSDEKTLATGGTLLPSPATRVRVGNDRGFDFEAPLVADHGHAVWQISRGAFQSASEPDKDLQHLILPICGEGVAEPFRNGLAALTEATNLIAKEDPAFGVPGDPGFMRFYESSDPVPDWIAKGKELYGKAVGEFYRANTRARDGARPLLLRHAKRATFALHYLGAAEATRNAGIAKAAGDDDARIENLELAIEAMHNALAIYAEVATDPGDAGAIALMNAEAYRPLLDALEE